MDRYPYPRYTILLEATRALAHIGVHIYTPRFRPIRILLEDNVKTSIEHQRKLNPIMMEVVIKEVLKWLNVGFIYATLDSPWVSPIHVVPKKGSL